jgi:hypothetical protein
MTGADRDRDEELDALERRLLRGVLIRRLVIGIGGIAVGIACLVLSVILVVQSFRLLRMAMVSAIVGVLGIIGGFVTLRVGEVREDLGVHEGSEPVPWKTITLASAAVALLVLLVAAWPLGIYRRIASLASPCRKVLSSDELVALGGAPFDIADVEDQSSLCVLTGVEPRGDRRILQVRIDNERSGYRLDDRRKFFRAAHEERLTAVGDEGWLLERPGERMIAVKRGGSVTYVNLDSSRYDDRVARQIANKLGAR